MIVTSVKKGKNWITPLFFQPIMGALMTLKWWEIYLVENIGRPLVFMFKSFNLTQHCDILIPRIRHWLLMHGLSPRISNVLPSWNKCASCHLLVLYKYLAPAINYNYTIYIEKNLHKRRKLENLNVLSKFIYWI